MNESVDKTYKKVQYTLQRKRGLKSLRLRVKDDGRIFVSAPSLLPLSHIESFIDSKQKWLTQRVEQLAQLEPPLKEHTYKDGDEFLFLGEKKSLVVIEGTTIDDYVELKGSQLVVYVSSRASKKRVKDLITTWYTQEGLSLYTAQVKKWIDLLGITKPYTIQMANLPKRLGSCSHKGVLTFSLRSLMLPPSLMTYIALHEVAHLIHFNHSPQFKQLLSQYMDDWEQRRENINLLRLQIKGL
jgi:predicted metal-dependent hydrolase